MVNILSNAIQTLKTACTGIDQDGVCTLDKSLVGDDFKFDLAMTIAGNAVTNGEITEEEFVKRISEKDKYSVYPKPRPTPTPKDFDDMTDFEKEPFPESFGEGAKVALAIAISMIIVVSIAWLKGVF